MKRLFLCAWLAGAAACVGDSTITPTDGGNDAIAEAAPSDGSSDAGADASATFKITVATKLTSPAQGGVTIAPQGTSCGTGCYVYPAGTSVTVTGAPIGQSIFQSWLGACQGFTNTCQFTVTKDATVTGWFRPQLNYMFVSSKKYAVSTLGMGGTLKTADDACDALAQAASLTGATGTYRAWLGTTTKSAPTRFVNVRGWIRVDGKPFGDVTTDFGGKGDGSYTGYPKNLYYPPRLDENGNDLVADADTKVAAGQLDTGETNSNCTDWTSTAGIAYAGNLTEGVGRWAGDFDSVSCSASARIYCFENVYNASVTVPAPTFHMAFITVGTYTPSTLLAADTLCQNEAKAASVSTWNLFKALVSTSSQSAFARLGTLGPGPFQRPDGVEIAATAADLGPGMVTAPIDVTITKAYVEGAGVWTGGGATPNAVAMTAQDACGNWAATSGNGVSGSASTTKPKFYNSNTSACTMAQRLYCVQP